MQMRIFKIFKIFNMKKIHAEAPKTCFGCKHLFCYNDGSVRCDLNAERACFSSNQKYYEDKEN